MGLDQWADYRRPGETEEDAIPFAEWGKHNRLQGWMENLYNKKLGPPPPEEMSAYTAIENEAAEILADNHFALELGGLENLSTSAATALAGHRGFWASRVELDGLVRIEPEVMRAFADSHGMGGGLGGSSLTLGINEVTPELACEMIKYGGRLLLSGEVDMSEEVAKTLLALGRRLKVENPGSNRVESILRSVHTITTAMAREWLLEPEEDSFPGFSCIEDAAAEILSGHGGALKLYDLEELGAGAAEALSGHVGKLDLRSLKDLDDAAIRALSKHEGKINLSEELDARIRAFRETGEITSVRVGPPPPDPAVNGNRKLLTKELAEQFVMHATVFCYPVELRIELEDLDELEKAIKGKNLPETEGFFFGSDSYEPYYDKEEDQLFLRESRRYLAEGFEVHYGSSW